MNYYNDQKQLIATSDDELRIYFRSLAGVSSVQNLPFVLPCPVQALFQVKSSAPLPKFIYAGGLSSANRVYPTVLPENTINLGVLCNGVNNNNLVPVPVIGDIISLELDVQVPQLGTVQSFDANIYTLNIQGVGGWTSGANTSSANIEGVVALDLELQNPAYDSTGPKDNFVNMTIAKVSVHGIPATTQTLSATDNANLPAGSTLVIDVAGNIIYTGQPTSEDSGGSKIEIYGINYNTFG